MVPSILTHEKLSRVTFGLPILNSLKNASLKGQKKRCGFRLHPAEKAQLLRFM
jgi:hypothetical protein